MADLPAIDPSRLGPPPGARVAVVGGCGGIGRPQIFDRMDPTLYAKRVPLKRVAVADDIVGPILFMLGPASRYVTGETLIVDGGTYVQ